MAPFPTFDRVVAGAIALLSWAALTAKFSAVLDEGNSATRAVWLLLRHFTNLTNLGIAATFSALALCGYRLVNQSLVASFAISSGLLLVASYWLLSAPLALLSGADVLLNLVVPIAALVFWLERVPKGRLTLRDPFLWLIYPLTYFDYALLRGAAESDFAYRFLNGIEVGWDRTFWTALLILLGFLDAGLALVWVDRFLVEPEDLPNIGG